MNLITDSWGIPRDFVSQGGLSFHQQVERSANFIPKNTPAWFGGPAPTVYYDELAHYERQSQHLPEGSEAWKDAVFLRDQQQQLIKDLEISRKKQHEEFVASGMTAQDYAMKVFRERHDPSGWRENFGTAMIETVFDNFIARPVNVAAETAGMFHSPLGEWGRSGREWLDKNEAVQATFDDSSGYWRGAIRGSAGGAGFYLGSAMATGGPWGAIGAAALDTYHGGVLEAQRAGLTGGSVHAYAATQGMIEGGVTALLSRVGLGGLERAGRIGLNRGLLMRMAEEIPEELLIAAGQGLARTIADVNPMEMNAANLGRIARDTIVQTIGTVGMVHGVQKYSGLFNDSGEYNDAFARAVRGPMPEGFVEGSERVKRFAPPGKTRRQIGAERMPSERRATIDVRQQPEPDISIDFNLREDKVVGGQNFSAKVMRGTSEVGHIFGSVQQGALRIQGTGIDETRRGKGYGSAAYELMAQKAAELGMPLASDLDVTEDAARLYESLERKGYRVEKNPDAVLSEGHWQAKSPVFTVHQPAEPTIFDPDQGPEGGTPTRSQRRAAAFREKQAAEKDQQIAENWELTEPASDHVDPAILPFEVRRPIEQPQQPQKRMPWTLSREEYLAQEVEAYGGGTQAFSPREAQEHRAGKTYDKHKLSNPETESDARGIGTKYPYSGPIGETVTVYRSVANDVEMIEPGQYVTLSKEYAQAHLDAHLTGRYIENPALTKGGKVLSVDLPAEDITVMANNELAWTPEDPYEAMLSQSPHNKKQAYLSHAELISPSTNPDKESRRQYREMLTQVRDSINEHVNQQREAYKALMPEDSYRRGKELKLLRKVRNGGGDPDQIRHFDEVVQSARNNYPWLGDEDDVFEFLLAGPPKLATLNSPEVTEYAEDQFNRSRGFSPSEGVPQLPDFAEGLTYAVPKLFQRRRVEPTTKGDYTPPTPEIARRIEAAKQGRRAETSPMQTLRNMWRAIKSGTAARPTLRTGLFEKPENAPYRFQLDQLRDTHRWAADEAFRLQAYINDPLPDSSHYDAYGSVLWARDMHHGRLDLDNQEYLYYGFTSDQQIADYRAQVEAAAQQDDETVGEALRRRAPVIRAIQKKLVEIGRAPAEILSNQDYYHREIQFYRALRRSGGLAGSRVSNPKKGFEHARRREGGTLEEAFDPSSDHLEAEMAWMVDALRTIRTHETVDWLIAKSGRYQAEMVEEATRRGMEPNQWKELLPEYPTLTTHVIDGKSHLNIRRTVPEQLQTRFQEFLRDTVLANNDFSQEEANEFLVRAFNLTEIILPKDVAAEITRLDAEASRARPEGFAADMSRGYAKGFKLFKEFILHNPTHIVPYNLRNLFGDAEAMFGAIPSSLLEVKASNRAVRNYFFRPDAGLDADLAAAMRYGAVSANFTDTEIDEIKDNPGMRRFSDRRQPLQDARRGANLVSRYREAVVRLSAYKAFKKKLDAGKLRDYGASKASTIRQLQKEFGNEAAAAQMSKDALLDYQDVSQIGQWLRAKMIPFYSFIETNIRRQTRMLANGIYQLPKEEFRRRVAAGETPVSAWMNARLAGSIALARQGSFLGAILAYNMLRWPDEWEELSDSDRKGGAIILGRNPDGSINLFRRPSAVGDFAEWFGINEAVALFDMWKDGDMSTGEYMREIRDSAGLPFAGQKWYDAMGPGFKGAGEIFFGKSLWPDWTNPRSVDRWEHAWAQLGLDDEYREYKGRVYNDGSRARPNYWAKYFIGVSDPRDNAISASYDMIDRYLERAGKPRQAGPTVSQWRNFRYAATADDYGAFAEVKRRWEDEGRDYRDFVLWTRRLDPLQAVAVLPGTTQQNMSQFLSTLDADEKKRLDLAREYAYTLQAKLLDWYQNGQ